MLKSLLTIPTEPAWDLAKTIVAADVARAHGGISMGRPSTQTWPISRHTLNSFWGKLSCFLHVPIGSGCVDDPPRTAEPASRSRVSTCQFFSSLKTSSQQIIASVTVRFSGAGSRNAARHFALLKSEYDSLSINLRLCKFSFDSA
jgi:hypothetical protein